jgi:hypothetical protein
MGKDNGEHHEPEPKTANQGAKITVSEAAKDEKCTIFKADLEQKPPKKRPRGRPWAKGVSGNPAGRPRGSLNKATLAMLAGIRQAEAELAKPRMLDTSRPYESWDGYFWQDGLCFNKDTLEALPHDGPPPMQPERLDPRERRTEITWKRRRLYLQNGWPFNPATWLAEKL